MHRNTFSHKMKYKLLAFLVVLSVFKTNAQLVSINNATIDIAPSYTLNHGDALTVTGSVKNAGSTTIIGNVHVHFAIDTSSTLGVNKFLTRVSNTYPQSNFLPSSTFSFSLGDNASQSNAYKVAGNGITVVVWATVGQNPLDVSATKDSVLSHIYVLPPIQSLEDEKYFEENAVTVQNPAKSILECRMQNAEFKTIELINANGSLIYHETIDPDIENLTFNISHLKEGIYYLRLTNKNNHKQLTKKIIILN